MPRDRNPDGVPRGDITLHPNDRDRARLAKLKRRIDDSTSDILRRALIHMLATLERGEQLHASVPSEHEDDRPAHP